MVEVCEMVVEFGLLVVVWLSFIMGGLGLGIVYFIDEVDWMVGVGLVVLFSVNVFIEELIYGWKEFEFELMCDGYDNVVVVCLIENVDLMGVYIGDLVIVVLVMMLIDWEYQWMCDLGIVILCEVGVDIGGCNIQFVVNLCDGWLIVIEMNLWVLCFSVLVFKVIGFLIVKIVVKLVIGYIFDEIVNDIIGEMLVCFEFILDYVVVKVLWFVFEKFFGVDFILIIIMKFVGEVMLLGCNFVEVFGKVMCLLEMICVGFWMVLDFDGGIEEVLIWLWILVEGWFYDIELVLWLGVMVEWVVEVSGVDLWFIVQINELVNLCNEFVVVFVLNVELLWCVKYSGLLDYQIVLLRLELVGEVGVWLLCVCLGIYLVYKMVDICVVEFEV